MGEVYRARDPRLGRDVALKVLPERFAGSPDRLERFVREARAAAALAHPNILVVYDVGEDSGVRYVVSELLAGETLRQRLAREGPLPTRRAVAIGSDVLRGLAAAHASGVVHRDLKPENLFLTGDGRVKILDFGLAKLTQPESGGAGTEAASQSLTAAGTAVGTVAYMSPEQVRGQTVDARSDLWSFGAVLYETLSGRRPFRGDTPADLTAAILGVEPPELPASAAVPPAVDRVVRHCLEKRPEDRFQSASDVAFALENAAVASGSAIAASPVGPVFSRREMLRLAGAGAVAGTAGAVGGFLLGRRGARAEPPAFQPLTFRRGTVTGGRFAPGAQSVVYSAAWEGTRSEVFTTYLTGPESRSLGHTPATVRAVSSRGDLALLLTDATTPFYERGTLAVAPLAGGSPRLLAEDVLEADWAPGGDQLCVVRGKGRLSSQLEYPLGRVLGEGLFQNARVSPRGDLVAFEGEAGLETIDRQGKRSLVLGDDPPWRYGLSWSPNGREIWYTGGASAIDRALWAVDLRGRRRLLARAPEALTIFDASPRGALLTSGFGQWDVAVLADGTREERRLGVYTRSYLSGLSPDGRTVLLRDGTRGADSARSPIYLRDVDGSEPVLLGAGAPQALSPDGRFALVAREAPARLVEIPIGPGEEREIPLGELTLQPYFAMASQARYAAGNRIFVAASSPGEPARIHVRREDGGWRPVTPSGFAAPYAVSGDGRWIASLPEAGDLGLFPVDGGEPRRYSRVRDFPIHWHADGRSLYLRAADRGVPARVSILDVTTGQLRAWRNLSPSDATALTVLDPVLLSSDTSVCVIAYCRSLTALLLASGIDGEAS